MKQLYSGELLQKEGEKMREHVMEIGKKRMKTAKYRLLVGSRGCDEKRRIYRRVPRIDFMWGMKRSLTGKGGVTNTKLSSLCMTMDAGCYCYIYTAIQPVPRFPIIYSEFCCGRKQ